MVLTIMTDGGFDFGIATDGDDVVIMAQLAPDQLSQLRNSPFTDAIALLGGNDYFENDDTGRIVFGNAGNDTIIGGVGNDTIAAGRDDDRIQATAGDNILFGNLGNDTLTGGSGNDSLFGGQGNDAINGGAGNDLLSGDRGFDTLTGGGGINEFILQASNANRDVITDFQPGVDKLRLPDGVSANLKIQATNNSTEIILNEETVAILIDVQAESITESDFIGGNIGIFEGWIADDIGNFDIYATSSFDGLESEELKLYNLINEYRMENNLDPIPASRALTTVANRRALDLAKNVGEVTHSGSDFIYNSGDSSTWSNMWNAPDRFNTGYPGIGYENVTGYSGFDGPTMTAEQAFTSWKDSPAHNAVILNQGQWASREWNALGVGLYNGYATLWFGEEVDPTGVPDGYQ